MDLSNIGWDTERTLLWIVLFPLLGALINGVAGRRADKSLVTAVSVGSVGLSFVLAALAFYSLIASEQTAITQEVYEWFSITVRDRAVPIRVAFVMDNLSGIMTVMVTGIATLIHVYSVGYMGEDPGYPRFMTYLNLFTASMLVLVLASNLPLMFVGWEGVGLCSYLLIGFWFTNERYAAAGRKAFVVNRIGDFGVLIGGFLLLNATRSFEFSEINAAILTGDVNIGGLTLGVSVATLAALFLFLGCTGKSAQIPLFVWLPDAMAGPTPVSALIHAATMVTAGVYLCARVSPVIVESPVAMGVIASVGALTALLAASIALVQNEMKKILAYSTVSQLGFMFAAVGMGAFSAGMFHVFTHAFFKACLFLGAGSVMHAVHAHGDADIRYLGGLKKFMPATHATFLVSCLAIAGLPVFSGFFSKDEILLGAATWGSTSPVAPWLGWAVFAILVVAATMTAFYMFRLYFKTFQGEFKGGHPPSDDDHAHHVEPHESPATMTVPLWVLGGGAAVVGLLGLPHLFHLPNLWGRLLTPRYEAFLERLGEGLSAREATEATSGIHSAVASLQFRDAEVGSMVEFAHGPGWVGIVAMVAGLAAALVGVGLAYQWYFREAGEVPRSIAGRVPALQRFLFDKWRVDELYGVIIVAPMKWLAVFAANFDRYVVDGLIAKVSAGSMKLGGLIVSRAQTGVIYVYTAGFIFGAAFLAWWFTFPHPSLTAVEVTSETVRWEAGSGPGYQYRFDFDADGEWDTEWSEDATPPAHDYVAAGSPYYGLVLIWESPRSVFGAEEILVQPGETVNLPVDQLPGWQRDDAEGAGLPTASFEQDEDGRATLAIRVNDAVLRGAQVEDGVARLEPGQSVAFSPGSAGSMQFGASTRLRVAVRVRCTVEVKSAFDQVRRRTEAVTLEVPRSAATAVAAREE